MTFDPIVITAAKRLHELRPRKPEEWEVGNWCMRPNELIECLSIGRIDIFHAYSDEEDRLQNIMTWIPHRATDWMEQPEWPFTWHLLKCRGNIPTESIDILNKNSHWEIVDFYNSRLPTFPTISFSYDPLTACAQAWLKAVEK